MSRRSEQLASNLREAVQEVINRGFHDPRISGLITITSVRLSDDLVDATLTVSVLPHEREDLTFHGLRDAIPFIRKEIGKKIDSKRLPRLSFKLDSSLKHQLGVLEALRKVEEEREKRGEAQP